MRVATFQQAVQVRDTLRIEYGYDASYVGGYNKLGWEVVTRCSACTLDVRQDGADTVTRHAKDCPNDNKPT